MANKFENWDGATVPSAPSGWTFGAGITTVAPGSSPTPISTPNCIQRGTGAIGTIAATWGTPDANSGNVMVLGTGQLPSGVTLNERFSVLARGSNSSLNLASHTMYEAQFKFSGFLTLNSIVAGSATPVGSALSFTAATGVWYQMSLTCNGTTITIKVQRLSDNFWLDSSGNFNSTPATAITRTDSSISGAGYAGWYAFAPSSNIFGDDWQLEELSAPSGAVLNAIEGRDVFAGIANFTNASLNKTEGHDSLAATGALGSSAVMSRTESHDVASMAGTCIVASMSPTERGDVFSALGALATAGSMSRTAAPDVLSALGSLKTTGSMAVAAGGDSLSASAMVTFHAVGVLIGGSPDAFSGAGIYGPSGVMAAVGQGDTISITGAIESDASMAVTERHDTMAGVESSVEYNIYANTGAGDPIDYTTPIATTGMLDWTSGPLAFPGTWKFGVRAFTACGEEKNLDVSIVLVLDASGVDITNLPPSVIGLRGFALAGSQIRLEWFLPAVMGPKAPTGFHVYYWVGGTPDYTTVRATVAYTAGFQGAFQTTLSGLTDGVQYTIGVRAFNATSEEKNTSTIKVTADDTPPLPPTNFVGSLVSES